MIERVLRQNRLISEAAIKQKTIQLFETLNVRFGVMIVGPPGGGKTTIYQVLAEVMNKLHEARSSDERIKPVKYKVLNPKAISMGELYGEVNLETQDWQDGLASKILRKFTQLDIVRKSWCVFDGPVDALWIENMNTVLDDNMMLSLMNGERIKLNPAISVVFEVQDLAAASLATVSRCGMVYVSPQSLPWRAIYYSWLQKYIEPNQLLNLKQMKFLTEQFETFVDLIFERTAKFREHEQISTSALQNIQCTCNFLEYFINDKKRFDEKDKKPVWSRKLLHYFTYAAVWGFGSAYTEKG